MCKAYHLPFCTPEIFFWSTNKFICFSFLFFLKWFSLKRFAFIYCFLCRCWLCYCGVHNPLLDESCLASIKNEVRFYFVFIFVLSFFWSSLDLLILHEVLPIGMALKKILFNTFWKYLYVTHACSGCTLLLACCYRGHAKWSWCRTERLCIK